ncbi:hypothetical protein AB4Z52_12780 [Rhizobium sp. 2YAF20]|uniref:hypothetical protein n=1 Tax=Rhizobium sp. 2YAF20 TaxID=3233027 RepID=UPI003F99C2E3
MTFAHGLPLGAEHGKRRRRNGWYCVLSELLVSLEHFRHAQPPSDPLLDQRLHHRILVDGNPYRSYSGEDGFGSGTALIG